MGEKDKDVSFKDVVMTLSFSSFYLLSKDFIVIDTRYNFEVLLAMLIVGVVHK
jgi:hypothetical protein